MRNLKEERSALQLLPDRSRVIRTKTDRIDLAGWKSLVTLSHLNEMVAMIKALLE